jgi:hypothetical protein
VVVVGAVEKVSFVPLEEEEGPFEWLREEEDLVCSTTSGVSLRRERVKGESTYALPTLPVFRVEQLPEESTHVEGK